MFKLGGNFVATKGSNSKKDSFKFKIIINRWRVRTKQGMPRAPEAIIQQLKSLFINMSE